MIAKVRVELPAHLRLLAGTGLEIEVALPAPVTQEQLLDELEQRYPALRGTIREETTRRRRPFLRFFACQQDLSHQPPEEPLPEEVLAGREPFIILGAIAGG